MFAVEPYVWMPPLKQARLRCQPFSSSASPKASAALGPSRLAEYGDPAQTSLDWCDVADRVLSEVARHHGDGGLASRHELHVDKVADLLNRFGSDEG